MLLLMVMMLRMVMMMMRRRTRRNRMIMRRRRRRMKMKMRMRMIGTNSFSTKNHQFGGPMVAHIFHATFFQQKMPARIGTHYINVP